MTEQLTHHQRRAAEHNARAALSSSAITTLDDMRPVAEIVGQYFAKGMACVMGISIDPVTFEKIMQPEAIDERLT